MAFNHSAMVNFCIVGNIYICFCIFGLFFCSFFGFSLVVLSLTPWMF